MDNLLIRLLEITIYSGIIFCVIMLFKKAFSKKISPILQSALWLILIARLLFPVTIDSDVKLIHIPAIPAVVQTETLLQQQNKDNQTQGNRAPNQLQKSTPVQNNKVMTNQPTDVSRTKSSTNPMTKIKITWQQGLVLILFVGVSVQAVMLAIAGQKLRKMIRTSIQSTPVEIQEIFNLCKVQMGITTNLNVIVVKGIQTPALTVSLFSQVIIPEKMADRMDYKELYFALHHELMHYKRKDHLLCMLLQVLQVLYWFNPFVWLSFRQMRMDIESACDAMVVAKMEPQIKAEYAKAIIKLSVDSRAQYMLGMALGSSVKTVEKRIRGIYMVSKSRFSIKFVTGMIACIIVISCFTTACQPSPEKDLVKNKKEQDLEQEMRAGQKQIGQAGQTAEVLASFPKHYQDEFEIDGLVVQVDADIQVPDVEQIISEKVKPGVMVEDDVKKIIRYFVGDNTCYPFNFVMSKEELTDAIISIKKQIQELENGYISPINEGDGTVEELLEIFKEDLKEHEALYLAEEEEVAPIPFEEITFDDKGAIEIQSSLRGEDAARVFLYNNQDEGAHFTFMNYSPIYEPVEENISIDISEEQAINKAAEVIQELELGDLEVMGVEKKYQVKDGKPVDYYDISYKRAWGGLHNSQFDEAAIPQSDFMGSEVSEEVAEEVAEEYRVLMGQMRESIQVDDTGIIGVVMSMPPEVIERISDDVSIFDFEQVKQHLVSNIQKKSWKYPGMKTYLKITQISLSSMYIVNKNNDQEYLTVPVWDFCGDTYTDDMTEEWRTDMEKLNRESIYKTTYLTLSAIDGSIVSRAAGY